MSYEPTLIISYDELAKVIEKDDMLKEYKDYKDTPMGCAKIALINEFVKERDGRDGHYPIILKGMRMVILDVEFTHRNKTMRKLLDELEIPYCINN